MCLVVNWTFSTSLPLCLPTFFLPPPISQLYSPMGSQANGGEAVPSARTNQRTFLDDVILTFSSPMAWLLVVALIVTWTGVAIVLFDLLDYKTLAGNKKSSFIIVSHFKRFVLALPFKVVFTIPCNVLQHRMRLNEPLMHYPSFTFHLHIHISLSIVLTPSETFLMQTQKWAVFHEDRHFYNNKHVSCYGTHSTSQHLCCFNTGCV